MREGERGGEEGGAALPALSAVWLPLSAPPTEAHLDAVIAQTLLPSQPPVDTNSLDFFESAPIPRLDP